MAPDQDKGILLSMRPEYVAKRVGLFFVCVWVAATLNFFLPRVATGRAARGVSGSIWDQYVSYVGNCLRLDFGYSSSNYPTRVNDLIATALPWTLALLITATLLAWVLGCLLGGLLAWPGSPSVLRLVGSPFLALQALPYYLFGLLLMCLFVFRLEWLPLMGRYTAGTAECAAAPGDSVGTVSGSDHLWSCSGGAGIRVSRHRPAANAQHS